MQAAYVERIKALKQLAASVPQEAADLDARIERLRERLKNGGPDLQPDELQMAIERAEAKRRELDRARRPVTVRKPASSVARVVKKRISRRGRCLKS